MITITDLAYAAGFVDGEGCIRIANYECETLHVSASQKDRAPLDYLASIWGGRIENQGTVWNWVLIARPAADFLQQIRPYLKVKGPQADLGIAYQQTKQSNRSENGLSRVDPRVLVVRLKIKERLTALKSTSFNPKAEVA